MTFITRGLGRFFGKLFHRRSIIIISEKKTNHVALSAGLQFFAFTAIIACVGAASYSTGSYMAAKNTLEEQDQTIKSVANSRIESNFSYMAPTTPAAGLPPLASSYTLSLTSPSYTLAAVSHDKLFARIAMLENRVKELKSANAQIIQTVRERTNDKIAGMEDMIRKIGLNPDTLKQEAARTRKLHPQDTAENKLIGGPQGGPFIPMETPGISPISKELDGKLEQVAMLYEIIGRLPLGMPVKKATPQSNFGRRIDPFTGRLAFHAGMDISGPAGSKIYATSAGRIRSAGWSGAYGNAVDIDHGYGVTTRYGHLSAITVSAGDIVKKGQVIGVQGSTGRSTGPHLHYEVRYNNKPINPKNFLEAGYYVSQIN